MAEKNRPTTASRRLPSQILASLRQLEAVGVPARAVDVGSDSVYLEFDQGEAKAAGVHVTWHLTRATYPVVVESICNGLVERQRLPEDLGRQRLAYWGDAEAMVAARIAPASVLARGKRLAKHSSSELMRWSVLFSACGKVYYEVSLPTDEEREEAAKHDHLRRAILQGEPPPLFVEKEPWCTRWTGTRAELLEAGICRREHFPENRKRSRFGLEEESPADQRREDVLRWTTAHVAGDTYTHCVYWNSQRFHAPRKRERDSTPEDLQDRAERWFMAFESMLRNLMSGEIEREAYGSCTVRYSDSVVEKVTSAIAHARQLLQAQSPVSVGTPVVDRPEKVAEDQAFAAFMRRTVEARPTRRDSRTGQ